MKSDKNNYRRQESRISGEIELDRLPLQIKDIATRVLDNPNYKGHSSKPFKNRGNVFFGEGPFVEFVGKGNLNRLVLDQNLGEVYLTRDHHNTYLEVV